MMGIQDKNTKISIKLKIYPKRRTLRSSKNLILINWYIVIKPSIPRSGRKNTSVKMSADSIQNYPPQRTFKLSLVKLPLGDLATVIETKENVV